MNPLGGAAAGRAPKRIWLSRARRTFFSLMQDFSGSEAGKGGPITFKDSS